jgi:hypothetical protein
MGNPKTPAENSQQAAKPTRRRGQGKPFQPGQSGNPGGRAPKTEEERTLEQMCRDKTQDALAVLVKIMDNGENERNRITAAMAIIERGHGKAVQPTTIGNPDGSKMDMNLTVTLVKP